MQPVVPTLERIRLYPLKSFDGVDVEDARVLASGALAWDRRYALYDGQGAVINGKRYPQLHGVRSAWTLEDNRLEFVLRADTTSLVGRLPQDAPRLEAWLGEYLGQFVELRENAAGGFPDDVEAHGPTMVASASVMRVADWLGEEPEITRRRFRANLEVAGVPAFWEDGLLGAEGGPPGRLRIGAVELLGLKPCTRCPVPTRNPDTGEADSGLPRRFSAQRQAELPLWAPRERFTHYYRFTLNTGVAPGFMAGRLRCGDEVSLLSGRFA